MASAEYRRAAFRVMWCPECLDASIRSKFNDFDLQAQSIDPISEDGRIVRVHLRPLVRLGLPAESLLDAFLRTAAEFHGNISTLEG